MPIDIRKTYKPSENVFTRKIEGEMIILPLVSGVGNLEGEMFSLNRTGILIWENLDGIRPLKSIIAKLSQEFDISASSIHDETLELIEELLEQKLITEALQDK